MYVCVCQGVTEREVEEALAKGACSLAALQEELLVARCCGTCTETVEAMVQRAYPPSPAVQSHLESLV